MSGQRRLHDYADQWLNQRQDLAFRTKELYRHLLDRHIFPSLGQVTLTGLTPSAIRSWHANLATVHPSTAAKAYRLLSAILRTAVADDLLLSSPCRTKGAGVERPAERPTASIAEVTALEAAMPEHLCGSSLRWRRDVNSAGRSSLAYVARTWTLIIECSGLSKVVRTPCTGPPW